MRDWFHHVSPSSPHTEYVDVKAGDPLAGSEGRKKMSDDKATDYDLPPKAVEWLKGLCLLPGDIRLQGLQKAAKEHGRDEVIKWFAEFMGLANSVIANNRDAIEEFRIMPGEVHPERASNINLPTVLGAMLGIELACSSKARGRCGGCAFRIGSLANQSPTTTDDALYALEEDAKFWCHEDLDEHGNPTKLCPGWAEAKARSGRRKKSNMASEITD